MFMCDRTCDLFKVGNFNIKRCLLFLVCIMLLVACGENDPIESRNRHPRQQEESHSEQSGSVPAVAKEDVAAYFRFDMSRDINVALGLVEAQKETLQINGKMIKITEAVVKRKDYQKGSFVLRIFSRSTCTAASSSCSLSPLRSSCSPIFWSTPMRRPARARPSSLTRDSAGRRTASSDSTPISAS